MKRIRILHLEDNQIDAEYVSSLLESHDLQMEIKVVETKDDFISQVQSKNYDLILADFKLPAFDGISALIMATKFTPDVPFIFVSGSMGEDLAVDALKHGATDYVLKHHITRLGPAVERALQEADEKRKRRQAENMQKRLVRILEGTSDFVGLADKDGMTVFLNEAARRMLEFPFEADVTKFPVKVHQPESVHALVFEEGFRIAAEEGTWKGESKVLSRSGNEIPVYQEVIAHKDEKGTVLYYSTIIRDISIQKEVENNLRTAKERAEESERLKDTFIATMSHEIRTPLNVIMGYAAYIRSMLDTEGNKKLNQGLWSIDRAGKRLMQTVDNILNLSTLRLGFFRPAKELLDLNAEVLYMYRDFLPFAQEKNLEFLTDTFEKPAIISADKFSIRGALLNIVDNAIKFTREGEVRISVTGDDRYITVECKDSGVGISEEYKKNLFEIFSQEEQGYTRSFDGLGLGLALSKKYIELNGGALEVESAKGKGTTVRVRFAIAPSA